MISDAARAALDELVARDDPTILGLVLSGSAARGMATERSDVDVFVVRDDAVEREKSQSAAIDEIPISMADLERVDLHGTGGWYFRWSFAYAQVLRDEAAAGSPKPSGARPPSTTPSSGGRSSTRTGSTGT